MNNILKATIKNAAVLNARALRHYKLAREHEALSALQQARDITIDAIATLKQELGL